MTENELKYWKSAHSLGFGRFILRRFTILSLALGTMGALDACFDILISKPASPEKLAFKFLLGLVSAAFLLIFEAYRWFDAERQLKGQKPFDLELALLALVFGLILIACAVILWWFGSPGNWVALGMPPNTILAAGCGLIGLMLISGSIFWSWMKVTAVLGAPTQGTDVK